MHVTAQGRVSMRGAETGTYFRDSQPPTGIGSGLVALLADSVYLSVVMTAELRTVR